MLGELAVRRGYLFIFHVSIDRRGNVEPPTVSRMPSARHRPCTARMASDASVLTIIRNVRGKWVKRGEAGRSLVFRRSEPVRAMKGNSFEPR